MTERRLNGSPIVYYISGREHAQWAVFIHAAFADHTMFDSQVKYFRDKYNVLTIDLIGHGRSVDAKKGDCIANTADWLKAIFDSEGIARAHIVGISLGAVIAQDFAAKYPESVSSLACFGGYDINNFDPKLQSKNSSAHALMMLKAVFSIKWFARANKKICAYTVRAQDDFYNINIRFPKKSFMYMAGLGALVGKSTSSPRNYPLMIGCGRHDIPDELTVIEDWKKREPECKTVIFEGAGHCVNMDVPDKFNSVMEGFWTEI